jgi:endonuclease/exonuclease/phosphatase (EEP) superfamily protein YafD
VVRTLAWIVVTLVAVWTVARAFGLERGYPLTALITFTPYVVVVAVVVAGLLAALRQRLPALVTGVLALALLMMVAPRALGGPSGADGPDGRTIGVLSVNLRIGAAEPDAVVALARRADVLSLQEIDAASVARLRAAGLDEVMPHAVVRLGPGHDGTAVFARVPLTGRPPLRGTWNPLAIAVADFDGTQVEFTAIHPPAPVNDARVAAIRSDLRALPSPDDTVVRILVGDFNATLDNATLRDLLDRGYEDAADAVGAGLKPTWPTAGQARLPVTIDHVLADARCGIASFSAHELPATDHRAVLARVVLPATAG